MEGGTEQNPAKYYLTEDMTLSDKVEVNGYAVLCLNGHILRGSGNDSVIYVGTGAQLTLCDCNVSLPHNYYVDTDGVFVFYDGTLPAEAPEGCEQGTLLGGIVTGGNAGLGGGVFVANNAVFLLESGVIAGNRSDYGGGGVLVYGTFAQQGGVIRDNRASTSGNNVYVQSGTYSMQDGYLDSASGSIDTYPDGSIYLSGGYFTSDPFQDTSDPLQDWNEYFTQDAVIVEIDENFGDPAFFSGWSFALYTRGTDVVPSIEAGETCAYDGQEKKLEIEGVLPAGVSVAYSENRRTDAGELTVTATFTGDAENYEAIAPMSATLRIGKARPEYTVPEGLSAHRGQELCEIALPDGWSWKDGAQTVSGETFSATAVYTPSDTQNYNTVEMLLTIGVESLSQGAVIGISVGSVLGAVLIAYGVLALLYKKGIVHGTFFAKIYPFIR